MPTSKITQKPAPASGVCALMIGVGHYANTAAFNLPDLSSATVSALTFGHWILTRLNYPQQQLKYLDLLVSSAAGMDDNAKQPYLGTIRAAQPQWDFSSLTMQSIRDAIRAWQTACNESEDNVGIFYFCGHGIEHNGVLALLAEDFDAANQGFATGSLDLRAFHAGTASFKARNKYFFIDSCRTTPLSVQGVRMISPDPVILPEIGRRHRGDAPLYLATAESDEAWGRVNGISQFTEAILCSLDGAGCSQGTGAYQGQWVVTSLHLMEGIAKFLELKRSYGGAKFQEPERGGDAPMRGTIIHLPGNSAKIPIRLSWPGAYTGVCLLDNSGSQRLTAANPSPYVGYDFSLPPPVAMLGTFGENGAGRVPLNPQSAPVLPPVFDLALS